MILFASINLQELNGFTLSLSTLRFIDIYLTLVLTS